MADFVPRAPRRAVHLPVILLLEGEELKGRCTNISKSGVLVIFSKPFNSWWLWLLGELSGVIDGQPFKIMVRVARADGRNVGLAFQLSDEQDRLTIQQLQDFAER